MNGSLNSDSLAGLTSAQIGNLGGDNDMFNVVRVIEVWKLDFHLAEVLKHMILAHRTFNHDERKAHLEAAKYYLERKVAFVRAGAMT